MNIGFLGLGIMGSRMAANLIKAGHQLTVWNRSADKAERLAAQGARRAVTPKEAVQGQEVVFTMLSTPRAVEETALGPDGFLSSMSVGQLWVDSSTVNPSFSRRMADQAALRQVHFLDAPVSGSKGPAEKGQLLFLVGGQASDLEHARPLLEKMGSKVIHAGGYGMGSSLKMVFNMLLGQSLLAFAEALVFGEALGLPRERLFDIFSGAAVAAPSATGKRAKIEAGDYEAEFPLRWLQKDLELVSVSAYEQGVAIPSANIAKAIYMLAARYGYAEKDISAVYQFLKEDQHSS